MRGLGAAVVRLVKTTDDGLGFVFEEEDFVNDGDGVLDLELREGSGDGVGDLLGVGGLAAEDDAQANKGGIGGLGAEQLGGDGGNLEGAGDADDVGLHESGAVKFGDGGLQHAFDVARVVFGGDDGEGAFGWLGLYSFDALQHGGINNTE